MIFRIYKPLQKLFSTRPCKLAVGGVQQMQVQIQMQIQIRIHYSHCTSIVADFESLPHRLLASHLYSPASFLLIFVNTNSLLLVSSPPPTLIHDTDGEGMPDALQNRVTLPPSVSASFCIGWMDERTVNVENYGFTKSQLKSKPVVLSSCPAMNVLI